MGFLFIFCYVNSAQNTYIKTNYIISIIGMFADMDYGIKAINITDGTNDDELPDSTVEWHYCAGLIFKRNQSTGAILLFGRQTGRIAVNPMINGQLGTWRII